METLLIVLLVLFLLGGGAGDTPVGAVSAPRPLNSPEKLYRFSMLVREVSPGRMFCPECAGFWDPTSETRRRSIAAAWRRAATV